MKTTFTSMRRTLLAASLLACAIVPAAFAAEISGVKFADTVQLAGRELKLSGLGMRSKLFVKVYAAGLYLPEKKQNVSDILKLDGPRRVTLVMMRDVSSEDFGKAYMEGLDNNLDQAEKARLATHISKVGDMFGRMDGLKKGDVLNLDYVPGTGTVYEVNGKRLSTPLPDLDYYNAMLRIWLGNKPVDGSLKKQLLGAEK
jgi:hypothetical protein